MALPISARTERHKATKIGTADLAVNGREMVHLHARGVLAGVAGLSIRTPAGVDRPRCYMILYLT
jgi:hypothetical protein